MTVTTGPSSLTAPDPAAPPRPARMSNGVLGMWFFLTSEMMFFVGVLSAFLVMQAGQPAMFHHSAQVPSLAVTLIGAVLLVASSLMVVRRSTGPLQLLIALGCGFVFLIVQITAAYMLTQHRTVVARVNNQMMVYDGSESPDGAGVKITGRSAVVPIGFDITHLIPADIPGPKMAHSIPVESILQDAGYGPSRNNFFACYFLMVGNHAVHLLAGLVAMAWLIFQVFRQRSTPALQRCTLLYWHFVNAMGLISALMLWTA